jgi:hypothetical protein
MALKDIVDYTRVGVTSPWELKEQEQQAAADRDLERLKVGSEAFYKQQLALSERAKRQPDNTLQQIMNDPNMPKREDYIDPTKSAGEQKQALQNFFRDQATYIQSNYPQYADKLGIKGADVRQAVGDIDVTVQEKKALAEADMATQTAAEARTGAMSKTVEPNNAELRQAEAALKQAGMGDLWGYGSPKSGDVAAVASRAKELRYYAAQQDPIAGQQPLTEFIDKAIAELYPQGGQATPVQPPPQGGGAVGVPGSTPPQTLEGVVPGVPGTGTPTGQPKRRVIDLSNVR